MGSATWDESGGMRLDPQYPGYAELARVAPGCTVVDLGCGRGEMLVAVIQAGAARAIGVEYAAAAVELARTTLEVHDVQAVTELHHGDARRVPVGDGEADLVTLLDVVEHLTPAELHATLLEAHRILRPGGRVFVHTMPNRMIYEVTYRLQRLSRTGRRRRWPANPRSPDELAMHVNEMTTRRLERALARAGFVERRTWLGDWIYTDFVPDDGAQKTYHRLARFRLTEQFGRGDLWAEATRTP